ncbi:hypothetical protein [Cytobacillus firmus]|uniref:hypothetical protein n=1 Tax=Cytobacillus firmus TaxID=1399 RepID=UPI0039762562|nr:hypothetical protein [Cytobacillus firmus]
MQKQSQPNQKSKEETNALIKAYQLHQDEDAQNTLVLQYQNLVEAIARKYSKGRSYHEDKSSPGYCVKSMASVFDPNPFIF